MDTKEVGRFEELASLLQGTARSTLTSVARPILLRLPEHVLVELDAMASLAGKTRNGMAIHLFSAAIEQLRETLDKKTTKALDAKASENWKRMQADARDREQVEG